MAIYEKPTKTLMLEFVKENLKPGQTFEKKQAVNWFAKHYPNIKPTTVQMHVEGMAINSTVRKHHPNIRPGSGHDLFFKVGPGEFRLLDPANDGQPIYRERPETSSPQDIVEEDDAEDASDAPIGSKEFAFERDLRNYLSKNLTSIEPGLKVFQEEEFSGIEYPVGGRYIDILATDANGNYVVVELKVSRGYERVVGQVLRYMAWVKKHLATGQRVRGMIVANEVTKDLRLAASLIPDLQLFEYSISMKLKPASD
jgi:hypothetical protein